MKKVATKAPAMYIWNTTSTVINLISLLPFACYERLLLFYIHLPRNQTNRRFLFHYLPPCPLSTSSLHVIDMHVYGQQKSNRRKINKNHQKKPISRTKESIIQQNKSISEPMMIKESPSEINARKTRAKGLWIHIDLLL